MHEGWEDSPEINLKKLDLSDDELNFSTEAFSDDNKIASDTESYVSVEIDKPDEKKISKIVLFWAVVFTIITLPIFYHNIRNYITYYMMPPMRHQYKFTKNI